MIAYFVTRERLALALVDELLNQKAIDDESAMIQAWKIAIPDKILDSVNEAHLCMKKEATKSAQRRMILKIVRDCERNNYAK